MDEPRANTSTLGRRSHARKKQTEVTTTRFALTTDASGVGDRAMGDDDDGSSRRSSPLDRSPRSPASRLGNARIANALACAPVTTESRDANARSAGPADDARETDGEDGSPAHRMSVYIGTWNVGNTAPRMDAAKAWLAPARGHAIVAVAAQEASYPHSKHNLSPKDVAAELSERKDDSNENPEVTGSTQPSRGSEGKTRGVGWRMVTRSKMTRFSGAVAGAVAGESAGLDLRRLALRAVVGDAHFLGLCSSGASLFYAPCSLDYGVPKDSRRTP